jgi:hypothetical protein
LHLGASTDFEEVYVISTVDGSKMVYWKLVPLLTKLDVMRLRRHKVSFARRMSGFKPQPHWIPLAIVSQEAEFIEFVTKKEMNDAEAYTGWDVL